MRHDVEGRLTALIAEVERRRLIQDEPIDPLSASLHTFERELAGLDTLGKSALLHELNRTDLLEGTMGLNLDMDDLERFISNYRKEQFK